MTDAAVDGNDPDELLQREIVPDMMNEICQCAVCERSRIKLSVS